MSVRSHIAAGLIPTFLLVASQYFLGSLSIAKSLESTQLDVYLGKDLMRSCGVTKLRSLAGGPTVKNASLGGLMVEFSGEPKRALRVFSVGLNRTRIQGAWRTVEDSDALRKEYETLGEVAAQALLQCASN